MIGKERMDDDEHLALYYALLWSGPIDSREKAISSNIHSLAIRHCTQEDLWRVSPLSAQTYWGSGPKDRCWSSPSAWMAALLLALADEHSTLLGRGQRNGKRKEEKGKLLENWAKGEKEARRKRRRMRKGLIKVGWPSAWQSQFPCSFPPPFPDRNFFARKTKFSNNLSKMPAQKRTANDDSAGGDGDNGKRSRSSAPGTGHGDGNSREEVIDLTDFLEEDRAPPQQSGDVRQEPANEIAAPAAIVVGQQTELRGTSNGESFGVQNFVAAAQMPPAQVNTNMAASNSLSGNQTIGGNINAVGETRRQVVMVNNTGMSYLATTLAGTTYPNIPHYLGSGGQTGIGMRNSAFAPPTPISATNNAMSMDNYYGGNMAVGNGGGGGGVGGAIVPMAQPNRNKFFVGQQNNQVHQQQQMSNATASAPLTSVGAQIGGMAGGTNSQQIGMQNGQQAMGYGLNAGVGGTQIGAGGTGNSTVLFPHQIALAREAIRERKLAAAASLRPQLLAAVEEFDQRGLTSSDFLWSGWSQDHKMDRLVVEIVQVNTNEVDIPKVGPRLVTNVKCRNSDNCSPIVHGWEDFARVLARLAGHEGRVVIFRNLFPRFPTRRNSRSDLEYRLNFSTESSWEFADNGVGGAGGQGGGGGEIRDAFGGNGVQSSSQVIYANPGGMLGNGQGGQPRDAFGGNGIQSSSQVIYATSGGMTGNLQQGNNVVVATSLPTNPANGNNVNQGCNLSNGNRRFPDVPRRLAVPTAEMPRRSPTPHPQHSVQGNNDQTTTLTYAKFLRSISQERRRILSAELTELVQNVRSRTNRAVEFLEREQQYQERLQRATDDFDSNPNDYPPRDESESESEESTLTPSSEENNNNNNDEDNISSEASTPFGFPQEDMEISDGETEQQQQHSPEVIVVDDTDDEAAQQIANLGTQHLNQPAEPDEIGPMIAYWRRKMPKSDFEPAQMECTICCDHFGMSKEEYEAKPILRNGAIRLPCQHVYHRTCIFKWLARISQCPNCRMVIKPPEMDDEDDVANARGGRRGGRGGRGRGRGRGRGGRCGRGNRGGGRGGQNGDDDHEDPFGGFTAVRV